MQTHKKKATSIRLSEEGMRLWAELAAKLGLNNLAVMELALRTLAKQHGIEVK